jgi:hypothetical protein
MAWRGRLPREAGRCKGTVCAICRPANIRHSIERANRRQSHVGVRPSTGQGNSAVPMHSAERSLIVAQSLQTVQSRKSTQPADRTVTVLNCRPACGWRTKGLSGLSYDCVPGSDGGNREPSGDAGRKSLMGPWSGRCPVLAGYQRRNSRHAVAAEWLNRESALTNVTGP